MTNTQIVQFIFFGFSAVLIGAALMTVISRNPVRSALFLVLAFFAAAGLWILLQAEFLGLVLILVYVGAVMTLFLFVVMTLNIDTEVLRPGFVRYFPYGIIIIVMLVSLMIYVVGPKYFDLNLLSNPKPADYDNTKALGEVLYTQYAYPFELAGVLLLIAIVSAICLTFRGRQGSKTLTPEQQSKIQRDTRVRLVKMPSEKKL